MTYIEKETAQVLRDHLLPVDQDLIVEQTRFLHRALEDSTTWQIGGLALNVGRMLTVISVMQKRIDELEKRIPAA